VNAELTNPYVFSSSKPIKFHTGIREAVREIIREKTRSEFRDYKDFSLSCIDVKMTADSIGISCIFSGKGNPPKDYQVTGKEIEDARNKLEPVRIKGCRNAPEFKKAASDAFWNYILGMATGTGVTESLLSSDPVYFGKTSIDTTRTEYFGITVNPGKKKVKKRR
jgi:hypothetical protein